MDIWKFSLHWGWNPIIFFIILIASLVLVLMTKKRVLWLVPALVMYLGLDWALPMSWLFKLVFWIGVIVVLVTAAISVFSKKRSTKLAKLPIAWISALMVVFLVLGAGDAVADALNGDGKKPSEETKSSQTPSPTASATSCDTPLQDVSGGEHQKVDTGFEEAYATATAGKTGADLEEAQRSVMLERAKLSAHSLAIWAHALGLYDDPNAWEALVDGDCFNEAGRTLYAQYEGAVKATGTTLKEDKLPSDAPTTVVTDGVFRKGGVIGEHTKVIRITLSDGSSVTVQVWCGNVPPTAKTPPPKVTPPPGQKCTRGPKPAAIQGYTWTPVGDCGWKKIPKTCPPGQHGTPPICKDGPEKQPENKDGSGKNGDSGSGTYVPPEQMEHPSKGPRTNPPKPKPTPPSGGTKTPTPEPTFTPPPPQPSAAPSSNPVRPDEGNGCAPGLLC